MAWRCLCCVWEVRCSVVRLLVPHQGEPGSNPGSSNVGIMLHDAARRRVFSGGIRFFPPFHSGAAPFSPRFTLSSQDLAVKSRPNLSVHNVINLNATGAALGERLACSPSTKANLVQSPAGLLLHFSHEGIVPDAAAGRRVFSGVSPVSPALAFRRCSILHLNGTCADVT
ncbi:hypothetical protein PR048_029029 [Dryococelus australis]|uniref:Secreted protein n=1 Tax=Dryococelus australis TaxID=614101 RepID=A0ABQ9GCM9_9NEOP|nr:hypothetical protein PR048_029029 [Dryococelus australis]